MSSIVLVFMLLTGQTGTPPTMTVDHSALQCGLPGAVKGVLVDYRINPTKARIPDPGIAGLHCDINVAAAVSKLPVGDYTLDTTVIANVWNAGSEPAPKYIGPDPHTSTAWKRADGPSAEPIPLDGGQAPPPTTTGMVCTVQSVASKPYSGGDAKLTVRCPTGGKIKIAKGATLVYTPK